jgi:hypothetical protein
LFLAIAAAGLGICAGSIFLRARTFGHQFVFAPIVTSTVTDTDPGPLPDPIEAAKEKLKNPPVWQPTEENFFGRSERGSLFKSEHYLLRDARSAPEKLNRPLYKDSLTGKDIPNSWFLQYGLPLLDPAVPMQDPDKDGFPNEDEYRAQTNPNDKASHPPYYSKLFFDKFVQTPFRMILHVVDGNPKGPAEKLQFQLDTIDLRQPTEFLKLGDMVPKTNFKLLKFEFKQAPNGDQDDASELTLVNVDTGKKVVLVLNQVANSPDQYASFIYEWPIPHQKIVVKTGQDFVLRPEVDEQHRYQLVDVNESEARIRLPSGEIQVIQRDPRRGPGASP